MATDLKPQFAREGIEVPAGKYVILAPGTTAQRPSSPKVGMTRYNTTLGAVESYNGSEWKTGGSGGISSSRGTLAANAWHTLNSGEFAQYSPDSSGRIITLDASPSIGDQAMLHDVSKTWDTNSPSLRSTHRIAGSTGDYALKFEGDVVLVTFINTSVGWMVTHSESAPASFVPALDATSYTALGTSSQTISLGCHSVTSANASATYTLPAGSPGQEIAFKFIGNMLQPIKLKCTAAQLEGDNATHFYLNAEGYITFKKIGDSWQPLNYNGIFGKDDSGTIESFDSAFERPGTYHVTLFGEDGSRTSPDRSFFQGEVAIIEAVALPSYNSGSAISSTHKTLYLPALGKVFESVVSEDRGWQQVTPLKRVGTPTASLGLNTANNIPISLSTAGDITLPKPWHDGDRVTVNLPAASYRTITTFARGSGPTMLGVGKLNVESGDRSITFTHNKVRSTWEVTGIEAAYKDNYSNSNIYNMGDWAMPVGTFAVEGVRSDSAHYPKYIPKTGGLLLTIESVHSYALDVPRDDGRKVITVEHIPSGRKARAFKDGTNPPGHWRHDEDVYIIAAPASPDTLVGHARHVTFDCNRTNTIAFTPATKATFIDGDRLTIITRVDGTVLSITGLEIFVDGASVGSGTHTITDKGIVEGVWQNGVLHIISDLKG